MLICLGQAPLLRMLHFLLQEVATKERLGFSVCVLICQGKKSTTLTVWKDMKPGYESQFAHYSGCLVSEIPALVSFWLQLATCGVVPVNKDVASTWQAGVGNPMRYTQTHICL